MAIEVRPNKQEMIARAGKMLEEFYPLDKISAKLKKDYKGHIHRSTVYTVTRKWPEWTDKRYVGKNPTGRNQYSEKND